MAKSHNKMLVLYNVPEEWLTVPNSEGSKTFGLTLPVYKDGQKTDTTFSVYGLLPEFNFGKDKTISAVRRATDNKDNPVAGMVNVSLGYAERNGQPITKTVKFSDSKTTKKMSIAEVYQTIESTQASMKSVAMKNRIASLIDEGNVKDQDIPEQVDEGEYDEIENEGAELN